MELKHIKTTNIINKQIRYSHKTLKLRKILIKTEYNEFKLHEIAISSHTIKVNLVEQTFKVIN